jgi:carboxyl-terminal processing protease
VLTESGKHFPATTYRTRAAAVDTRTPLVVLVDGDTASSAEIVTGALRDASRAGVVGTRTFGKGVVQDIAALEGGGALKFTMAEYMTPGGQRVNGHGIVPDVQVAPTLVEGGTPIDVAASFVAGSGRTFRGEVGHADD